MSNPQTTTLLTRTERNSSVPKDEQTLEEDRSVGGSDGAAFLADEAHAAPASESPERIDTEQKAISSHPQQTDTSNFNEAPPPAQKAPFFGIPQSSGARANFLPSTNIMFEEYLSIMLALDYDDDYETRFDPDPKYQEASANARVFRVYMEEAAKYDALTQVALPMAVKCYCHRGS